MKNSLIFLLVLISTAGISQERKGYAVFQAGLFSSKTYKNPVYINGGVGAIFGNSISVGLSADFFIFKAPTVLIPKLDFRGFFLGADKKTAPFISLQPGIAIFTRTPGAQNKTGFAFDAMLGLISKDIKDDLGITISAGYGTFRSESFPSTTVQNRGLKISAGFAF